MHDAITRLSQNYVLDLEDQAFELLLRSINAFWDGPRLAESEFPNGIFDIDFSENGGSWVYFSVEDEHNNDQTFELFKLLIDSKVVAIQEYVTPKAEE